MGSHFTLSFWVRPRPQSDLPPPPHDLRTLVNKEGEYQLSMLSDGRLFFTVAEDDQWWPWREIMARLPEQRWSYVAWVREGKVHRFYVNGRLRGVFEGPETIGDRHPNLDELRWGGRQHTNSGFVGDLADVRVQARARHPGSERPRSLT